MKKLSALIALSLCAAAPIVNAQTCASAIPIASNTSYVSDTTGSTNWMTSFGPLVSPSNDNVYTFVAGAQPLGTITPDTADYAFAMYLINACSDSGTEPVPVAATATVGTPISLATATAGTTYYLAITGTAAGGPTANGIVNFTTTTLPVTLQSFEID